MSNKKGFLLIESILLLNIVCVLSLVLCACITLWGKEVERERGMKFEQEKEIIQEIYDYI